MAIKFIRRLVIFIILLPFVLGALVWHKITANDDNSDIDKSI